MKYLGLRLSVEEFEAVKVKLGRRRIQPVVSKVINDWAAEGDESDSQGFLKLAARFYRNAPADAQKIVTSIMEEYSRVRKRTK